jgi:hypothetical protein
MSLTRPQWREGMAGEARWTTGAKEEEEEEEEEDGTMRSRARGAEGMTPMFHCPMLEV